MDCKKNTVEKFRGLHISLESINVGPAAYDNN